MFPSIFNIRCSVSQPVITQQPQSQTVSAGAAATFSVTATGGNLTYQWSSAAAGGSSFTPISGATGSSYTASVTTLGQSGTQYMCVVTNTAGTASSSAATLTVVASLPSTNYVTSVTLGTLRNDFSGWVGMSITVGRISGDGDCPGADVCTGQHGQPHGENRQRFNGQDVSGGSATVSMVGRHCGQIRICESACGRDFEREHHLLHHEPGNAGWGPVVRLEHRCHYHLSSVRKR